MRERERETENGENGARGALPSPDAFPSAKLGNNMTPIKGRLWKNTTPTCRRTAAQTLNLQKDPQQRQPDVDDSSEKAKYTKHKPHIKEADIYKKIKALENSRERSKFSIN